jgi:peptidoglycan LD-endopeptidase CwlK
MRVLDKISLERIQTAHPLVRAEILALYTKAVNAMPVNAMLRMAYVYRSPQEQDAIFNQRPKVTNARAWQSIHQYGLAFDIVILYDKDGNGTFETASWDRFTKEWLLVTKIFTEENWTNGFMSSGKKWDYPHFQKDFRFNWRQMKAKIDSGNFTVENGIKYIRI